jgi:hypothetical protein
MHGVAGSFWACCFFGSCWPLHRCCGTLDLLRAAASVALTAAVDV